MKNLLHLFYTFSFLLLTIISYAQPAPPSGKKWIKILSLSDNFNTNFDTKKWIKTTWDYDITTSITKMLESQVSVSGGNLKIKAELYNKTPNQIDRTIKAPGFRWMKSGRVLSKAAITYPMYSESRIKTSSISGYNTYWFNKGDSKQRDEIDVIENNAAPTIATEFGKDNQPYFMLSSLWTADNNIASNTGKHFDTRNLPNGFPGKGKKVDEEYFTYGVYWKNANSCEFYINGKQVLKSTPPKRAFTKNVKLQMYFGLWSNHWDGYPIPTNLQNNNKNTMYIDWVNTYKLVNSTENNGATNTKNNVFNIKKSNAIGFSIDGGVNGTDGQNVKLWAGNTNNINQQWIEISRGNGYYTYQKKGTNLCLDGGNGGANDQNIKLWTIENDNQNQHWKKVSIGNNIMLQKRNAPNYSIDGGSKAFNNQNLKLWRTDRSNKNQLWVFSKKGNKSIDFYTENSIYPNPVINTMTLTLDTSQFYQSVKIIDLIGAIQLQESLSEGILSKNINTSSLQSGFYFLVLEGENGTKTFKFSKID